MGRPSEVRIRGPLSERGFSLMEAIVATVIAVIAVLGLAYSFGQGRAMISRFQIARAALAAAQERMEILSVTPATDSTLALGPGNSPGLHGRVFMIGSQPSGVVQWSVTAFDDPVDGLAPLDPSPLDLKQVTVTAQWTIGFNPGNVTLTRFFPAQ
jgi:hypothetical protein